MVNRSTNTKRIKQLVGKIERAYEKRRSQSTADKLSAIENALKSSEDGD